MNVNTSVYMTQVQIRLPDKMVSELDEGVAEGRFRSRSDAIKTILSFYEEREKTREFYMELQKRSKEAREKPELLVPLEEL